MPALSMSQSTLQSTQSSSISTSPGLGKAANKRSYDDEIEDDMDAYFDEVEAEEQTVPVEARRIAQPKRSPRKAAQRPADVFHFPSVIEGDFENAPFLVPMETDS